MRDHRRAVFMTDIEHQPAAVDAQMQRERPFRIAVRRKAVLFDEIVDRDRALVLDVGVGAADRALVERDGDQTLCGMLSLAARRTHRGLNRIATERAWAVRPSASPSAIAAGP